LETGLVEVILAEKGGNEGKVGARNIYPETTLTAIYFTEKLSHNAACGVDAQHDYKRKLR